jgi:hypothetical protein
MHGAGRRWMELNQDHVLFGFSNAGIFSSSRELIIYLSR